MDILDALLPLHRVCQLCNLWQWRVDTSFTRKLQFSRWLQFYGCVVLMLSSGYLLYDLFNDIPTAGADVDAEMDADSNQKRNIGYTVDFIQLVGIRVAHVTALLEALWQRQAQSRFFTEVREIDHKFASALHLDVDNGQLRRRMIRRAMWILSGYVISQGFILLTKMLASEGHFVIYWLCYLLPLLVCGVRYFQIYTAILIVQQRLEMLQRMLESLQLSESEPQKPYVCMSIKEQLEMEADAAGCMQRLLSARVLYQRIWMLVSHLNSCYGLSMLINLGNDFLAITSNCYWMFLNFRQFTASPFDFLQIVGSTVWSAPHLVNVLVLALMCERAAYFTTRLALSLHHIRVDLQNELHNALITQFSLQLLHQRLQFSAAGFFNVDCTLLYTIVGATTTYLIILIQFHMSESSNRGSASG
ncbi:putative gustatory receptor 2a [Drosophila grimshawi]|uniref:Gustatory receptor n=1 Tax=Drosophila grimshawi TaxID=7222 RepID=B4JNT4_DROGR|nr:putative gustatory receptor 2a [Drosophila grimshawi]EDV92377.1 GH24883 [Drosophila grimshawi]